MFVIDGLTEGRRVQNYMPSFGGIKTDDIVFMGVTNCENYEFQTLAHFPYFLTHCYIKIL